MPVKQDSWSMNPTLALQDQFPPIWRRDCHVYNEITTPGNARNNTSTMVKFSLKPNGINFGSSCCSDAGCTCKYCYYHSPDDKNAVEFYEKLIQKYIKENNYIVESAAVAQSATEKNLDITEDDTSNEQEVNLEFSDAIKQYGLVIGDELSDPTFAISEVGDRDSLHTFMSRPVRIFSKFWEVGESPAYVNAINPWELFLNNPRVINKLETFKLLQGKLCIKIVVNGSPFHYGKMIVACRPSSFDNNTLVYGPTNSVPIQSNKDSVGANRNFPALRTLYTSRPHVYVDPSTNQPQLIHWPFFTSGNYIDLQNPITVQRMGVLEIWELQDLRHANGATDGVEITMFAWMEDAKFAGLTAAAPVVAQSGMRKRKTKKKPVFKNSKGQDEYKTNGLISTPASTVESYAGYFVNIPYIGMFAKATQIAAGAIGGVAKIFGYSRPAVLSDTEFYRPQPLGNMANYSGADPVHKLSLDPKQELTVDPGTVGLPSDDQMSFAYLIKREAWIDEFIWNLPTESTLDSGLIYSTLVHPRNAPIIQQSAVGGTSDGYTQTPISFVTTPFEYWTGSLRFRFQVVCSQFHRGRLMFVYEPTATALGTIDSTNNRFTHIVDIAEERDVTFEVNWTQQEAYRRTDIDAGAPGSPFTNVHSFLGPNPAFVADDLAKSNGILQVFVLNSLAAPTDAANVKVNVFISGGDSFEVKAPGPMTQWAYSRSDVTVGPPALAQSSFFYSQSGERKDAVTDEENMPEQDTMYVLNGSSMSLCPKNSNVFFGEHIVSVRSLLKRYTYHRTLLAPFGDPTPTGETIYITQWIMDNLPVGPGRAYGSSTIGSLTAISDANPFYNICSMTYLRYFVSAYVGYKGSIRWKIGAFSKNASEISLRVARTTNSKVESVSNIAAINAGTSRSQVAQNFLTSSSYVYNHCGTSVTVGSVNPTLEYELPFYHNLRYAECNLPIANSINPYNDGTHCVNMTNMQNSAGDTAWVETHCATGEDFSLFFFIGAPVLLSSDVTTVTPA